MAQQADSENITLMHDEDPVERNRRFDAEIRDRELKSLEDADAAGAHDIIFHLEEPLRRIERAASALRLVAGSADIEGNISDALYLLTEQVEDNIETVQENLHLAFKKLSAFGHGLMSVTEAQPHREPVAGEVLDRIQRFIEAERAAATRV